MAEVAPFRAVTYASPSGTLVSPPYDVVTREERDELLARSPHNVAHLTLAEHEEDAGRRFREWLEEGVLVREPEPSFWVLEQEYVGPDGVARTRLGLVASLRAERYDAGSVLPHERTHAGPKESRLRLLRAARAQLEPILLLHEGSAPIVRPARDPDLAVDGSRLWRVGDPGGIDEFFAGRQLLIADGHHRYETAVAYAAEAGGASAQLLAVLVSTADPGLQIFPTHRVFSGRPGLGPALDAYTLELEDARERLRAAPYEPPSVVAYRGGKAALETGVNGELDVELVDRRYGHDGIAYTPDWREAVARVDHGDADVAFLLRPTRIEDVFARARRGVVLPQKTTYFFPKLLTGLLFLPLE